MTGLVLLYVGSALVALWGIAHLFPTKNVVRGFGEISADNRRIITMEWLVEGVSLIFIGVLVAAVAYSGHGSPAAKTVYRLSFLMLNVLSAVSLFTGFKINFPPFKLCPFIFSGSSVLIIVGAYL